MPTSHKINCWHFLLFVPLDASSLSKIISFSNMISIGKTKSEGAKRCYRRKKWLELMN
jgi:hypothetical protein